ncbi:MAG: RNA pseudouridine synthase, partial [Patescibacteria group bacterium]|nr:RNA pseudouridine synthase [Patescibacteria group bacterium]
TGTPPRYGIVHRLDKDTSGILLIAKNNEMLNFLKEEFKERKIIKKYIALAHGSLKNETGVIETLIGRGIKDRKKQKVYSYLEPLGTKKGLRQAKTYYRVLKRFRNYTLIEASPKTGRKHQIRVHLHYIGNPIAGDKVYKFKNQIIPKGLKRQFLSASYIKINLLNKKTKEFKSELPNDLKIVLDNINKK